MHWFANVTRIGVNQDFCMNTAKGKFYLRKLNYCVSLCYIFNIHRIRYSVRRFLSFLWASVLSSHTFPSLDSQWCYSILIRQFQVPFNFSQLVVSQKSFLVQNTSLYIYIYTWVLFRCSPHLTWTKINPFTISRSREENHLSILLAPNIVITAAFGHGVLTSSVCSSQDDIKGGAVLHFPFLMEQLYSKQTLSEHVLHLRCEP